MLHVHVAVTLRKSVTRHVYMVPCGNKIDNSHPSNFVYSLCRVDRDLEVYRRYLKRMKDLV